MIYILNKYAPLLIIFNHRDMFWLTLLVVIVYCTRHFQFNMTLFIFNNSKSEVWSSINIWLFTILPPFPTKVPDYYVANEASINLPLMAYPISHFAMTYFPMFGFLYSFSRSAFFLFSYFTFWFLVGPCIFRKTCLSKVSNFSSPTCVVE